MIKRTIEISGRNTRIRLENGNLVFCREKQEIGRVACDDLGFLILDDFTTTCSQAALTAAVEAGAAVIVCSNDHQPAGLMLPFAGNQLHAQRLRQQVETTKPLEKRLWQQLVIAKLKNQSAMLPAGSAANKIVALSNAVFSGDPDNKEAQGARIYWPVLFEDAGFKRARKGKPPNNLLNYGYMVLRAACARAICTTGLHPALGIHHSNRSNPFALADDLMEPYRPFVDRKVKYLWDQGIGELRKNSKAALLGILSEIVRLRKESSPLMVALNKSANSLCNCLTGKAKTLDLPAP